MTRLRIIFVATSIAALAAACSDQAPQPRNQQAGMVTDTSSEPFGQAEKQMQQQLADAIGANPSQTWVRKMIAHHRGAVQMSEALLEIGGDPEVLALARTTADKQLQEINELEKLLTSGESRSSDQMANPYQEAVRAMQQRMMNAMGANPAETWMRKMLEHHRGGVAMSNVLLKLGGEPKVLEKARITATDQAKDAAELETMLGLPAATPPVEAAATPTPTRTSTDRTQKMKPDAPKPTPRPAEEESDPHTGHDMGNMSN